jgi:sodium/potassium/calcium exchanger 6
MWIQILCSIIVDVLKLFGVITGFSPSLLGITIISWGNTLGDLFASISLAKSGFGEMAITGTMAGTIFNLMLGLGIITLFDNLESEEEIKFDLQHLNTQCNLALLGAILMSNFALFWIACSKNFIITSEKNGKELLIIYIVAIVLICLLTLS